MIKYLTIALLGVSLTTQAQTVILEEDFTSGIPTTWATFDEDGYTAGHLQEHTSLTANVKRYSTAEKNYFKI